MKTEPISMGEIARNAFMKTPDSFLDEPWANAATAVIAEHERRRTATILHPDYITGPDGNGYGIGTGATKPEWKLPDPPEGEAWHRTDFSEQDLRDGERPLLMGEPRQHGDYFLHNFSWQIWEEDGHIPYYPVSGSNVKFKTARPLPVKPDPFAAEKAAFAAGKTIQYYSKSILEWLDCYPCPPSWAPDYAYRVKPEPALVPLGPDDVPPFSAIRWSGWETTEWALVLRVTNETVYFSDRRAGSATLNDLRAGNVKINRSIPLTGKWDADAWTACFKEVQP